MGLPATNCSCVCSASMGDPVYGYMCYIVVVAPRLSVHSLLSRTHVLPVTATSHLTLTLRQVLPSQVTHLSGQ